MSRKKVKKLTAKQPAASDNAPPVTGTQGKDYVIKTTQSELYNAMDVVAGVSRLQGAAKGFAKDYAAARTPGEQRVLDQTQAASSILDEVLLEIKRALKGHGPMTSGHEGFAVIREELDELWDEIKADRGKQASARMEAIQVAAMAVRYVLDLNPR